MITITKQLTKYWILSVLLLVSNPSWSQEEFNANARVRLEDVGPNFIIIRDTRHATFSTVKVFLPNNKPGRMQDLKKGDFVNVTLLKVGKVEYADTIRLLPK
jgi:hypothetical protein